MLSLFLPPDKVAEIMEEAKGPDGKNIWDKLSHVQPQTLAGYLRNEYPQTAAVILARLPAAHAAKVMRLMPNKNAADIAVRMVRMTSVQRPVLNDIEEALKREFTSVLGQAYERDSASIVAEMLNRSDQEVVDRILGALEDKEPQATQRIRRIMFTFEDLRRIEPGTFGLLIAEIPTERLPIALSAASDEIRNCSCPRCRNGRARCWTRKWKFRHRLAARRWRRPSPISSIWPSASSARAGSYSWSRTKRRAARASSDRTCPAAHRDNDVYAKIDMFYCVRNAERV